MPLSYESENLFWPDIFAIVYNVMMIGLLIFMWININRMQKLNKRRIEMIEELLGMVEHAKDHTENARKNYQQTKVELAKARAVLAQLEKINGVQASPDINPLEPPV